MRGKYAVLCCIRLVIFSSRRGHKDRRSKPLSEVHVRSINVHYFDGVDEKVVEKI
jgi:hypothetical protein